MWSNDDAALRQVEQSVRHAGRLPRLSADFRDRVLHEAFSVRQRSLSLHRIQTLTTSFLAASLLLFLPGYYRSLHAPAVWTSPTALSHSWTVSPAPGPTLASADAFEWSLVQAHLADRNESARIIRGAL